MQLSFKILLILTGVMLTVSLLGCSKQKYKLNFGAYGFKSSQNEYAAGDKVTVYFDMIGTDTDYNFYLDDKSIKLKQDYDDRHGYVFTFTMPDHDVTLNMDSYNSMVYTPQINVTFINEVKEADVWILPQTDENINSSTWGQATITKLPANEERSIDLQESLESKTGSSILLRIINIIRFQI